ncbi:MAG: hypothetical protein AMJ38_05720 [Dehalococcoidia bacterium DG_22]|nr:MAG: hypothetical protein AMJ38_05720 [Dehalococcoidia bacterium DG_22]
MLRPVVFCRWLAALALVLPLLFIACAEEEGEAPSEIGLRITTVTPTPTPPPVLTPVVTATPSPTPTPVLNVCPENPDPASPDIMVVEEPQEDDALTSPAHVRGWGAGTGFEDAGVQVAIYDATGEPVAEVTAPPLPAEGRIPPSTIEVGEFSAPFAADVAFRTVVEQPGCVQVFELSAADGSPIHVVQIPVLLQP